MEQKQNIAIAESLGWVNTVTALEDSYHLLPDRDLGELMGRAAGRNIALYPDGFHHPVPSYTTDLNACHEMENGLDENEWNEMFEELIKIRWDAGKGLGQKHLTPTRATAQQRADAYCKVMGLKWEDEA